MLEINIPKELKNEIEVYAKMEGITINEFILLALGEKVGELRGKTGRKNLYQINQTPLSDRQEAEKQTLQPSDPKTLLKAAEIAKYLKISRSATYKLMRSGDIPIVNFGRNVRVRLEDLDQFIMDSKK
jgi:excisionase family DNA binding protein